jgi:hypothetical protein
MLQDHPHYGLCTRRKKAVLLVVGTSTEAVVTLVMTGCVTGNHDALAGRLGAD